MSTRFNGGVVVVMAVVEAIARAQCQMVGSSGRSGGGCFAGGASSGDSCFVD